MKVRFSFSIIVLSALLALVLAGCSLDGEVPQVVESTIHAGKETIIQTGAVTSFVEAETCSELASGASMAFAEALSIAQSSPCVLEGQLSETHFCNENSGTWWIDMGAGKPGCSPACVVSVGSGSAEINWRCTGALPPTGDEEETGAEPAPDAGAAPTIDGWLGIINASPPGSQSRYVFNRTDGRSWTLGATDEALWSSIAEAAWLGGEVQLRGVETPMPGLINVTSLAIVGEPPVEARNLSAFAHPRASSALPSDRLGSYQAWSAVDGRAESPWCEGVDGPGTGQWLELLVESPLEATRIRLANGYSYDDELYTRNSRVKRATFIFSSGERLEWLFDDTSGWQEVPLARAPGPNMTISGVTILIEEVYPGSVYDDTCIGEVEIWGRTR
jgi:hypothetical protein